MSAAPLLGRKATNTAAAAHHALKLTQQEMDDEAAVLRLRHLRGNNPAPSPRALIKAVLIGTGLALAWLLLCLWVQSW